MSHRCQEIETLAELLALPAADPRRADAEACPRCGALLAALRAFQAGDPLLPHDERLEADHVLADFLARHLKTAAAPEVAGDAAGDAAGVQPAPARPRRRRLRLRRPLVLAPLAPRPRRLLTFASVAAALAVVTLFARQAGDPILLGARLRGGANGAAHAAGQAAIAVAPARLVSEGGLDLRWSGVAGADRYFVELFTADLDTLAVLGPLSEPRADLEPSFLALPGATGGLLVKVHAMSGERALGASALQALNVAAPVESQ